MKESFSFHFGWHSVWIGPNMEAFCRGVSVLVQWHIVDRTGVSKRIDQYKHSILTNVIFLHAIFKSTVVDWLCKQRFTFELYIF